MADPFKGQGINPFAQVNTTYQPPSFSDEVDAVVPAIPVSVPASGSPTRQQGGAPSPAPAAAPQLVPAAAAPGGQPPIQFTASTLASSEVTGSIGRPGSAPVGARPPPPLAGASTLPGEAEDPSSYAFYNVRRYRPYFDVDTKDVLWRVGSSFIGPLKPDFMSVTMTSPDLYGPFWIATTLIFVTAVAGNYADLIAFRSEQKAAAAGGAAEPGSMVERQWYTNYAKMSYSALMFYGYVFAFTLGLYFALRWFKSEIKLANVWCIYGYAMTIFIPMAFVCIVPLAWLRWLAVMLATGMSGLFIVSNLKQTIYTAAPARALLLLGIMLALHTGVGLALRLYFFSFAAQAEA